MCRVVDHVVVVKSRLVEDRTVYVVLSSGTCWCIRPVGQRCERCQEDVGGDGLGPPSLDAPVPSPGSELAIEASR
jgi:hypothetical protein